ncbi:type III polyketide synthase [Actinomadura craniellae]|uniref:Type III polyketide synthase n=1 Tax=Actinomadura craniellae TaxID=2231787 RepID=A0A365GW71_9ACTN|nr:type III polyketide synthase [Actinomadura craniellae]RAY11044.1 type III polyketide synthase [Actinomadura craniellae]
MTVLLSVEKVLPPYRYTQEELAAELAAAMRLTGPRRELFLRLSRNVRVRTRHTALPKAEYHRLRDFGATNDAHLRAAADYATRAVDGALRAAGVAAAEVDLLLTQSVTGIAVPPFDVDVIERLGLRPDVRRLPLFGLGCGGGGAALARVHDHLRGHPDQVAVAVSAELCSLTAQRDTHTAQMLLGSALCGDAVAAVVACGSRRAGALGATGPRIVGSRSRLYPGSRHMAGWEIGASGLRIVLAPDVAEAFGARIGADVRAFLRDHGHTVDEVTGWPCHPGGPKVLEGVAAAVGLPAGALDRSWEHLAACGNCSSASVLHILADTIAGGPPAGTPGLLLSFGPGLFSELVLLNW